MNNNIGDKMNYEQSMKELAHELAKQFEKDFYKVAIRELNEEDFLNKKDFPDARSRAAAGVVEAAKGTIDTLGLAIAVSYEVKDGDDTTEEQASLLKAEADPEVGTRSWWNGG